MKLNTTPTVILSQSSVKPVAPTPDRNVEVDSKQEMSEVLRAFKERAKREQKRYWDAVDSEYYTVVCFQTRAQRDEFLEKSGLSAVVGNRGARYLDGLEVAQVLGISVDSPTPPMPKLRRATKDVAALILK